MAKYIYTNGERRVYRGVCIYYDLDGKLSPGYYEDCHWYIQVCHSIASGVSRTTREYFATLKSARNEIDRYYKATEKYRKGERN